VPDENQKVIGLDENNFDSAFFCAAEGLFAGKPRSYKGR
jgi:hypothetical protein